MIRHAFRLGRLATRGAMLHGLLLAVAVSMAATPTWANTPPPRSVYVASGSSIVAIDASTNVVRGTVPVAGPAAAIAVSSDGTRVFATHTALDSVSVIDAATLTVVHTIGVGDAPTAAVVSPSGDWLYVNTTGGVVQVVDTVTRAVVASIPTASAAGGSLARSGDGTKVYLASGAVSVIDTATNTFAGSFLSGRWDIEVSPDGSRAYVLRFISDQSGAVDVVDTATRTVVRSIGIGGPGRMTIAPDGSRLYVGLAGRFVSFGWSGGGFIPGGFVTVIDLLTETVGAHIDLGGETADHLVVTPDRRRVYIGLSTSVAAADVNTNAVVAAVPVTVPGVLGAGSDGSGIAPYLIDAVDDVAPTTLSSGTAVATVLVNDKLGGLRPTPLHVSLSQVTTTDPKVTLDTATGAVNVALGAAIGPHSLEYRICERVVPTNCDNAVVTLTLRAPYPIDAVDDSASTAYSGPS